MRKQSPETKLRHAKTDIRNLENALASVSRELLDRRHYGAMLANICFNVAQHGGTPASTKDSMTTGRKQWDSIKAVEYLDELLHELKVSR